MFSFESMFVNSWYFDKLKFYFDSLVSNVIDYSLTRNYVHLSYELKKNDNSNEHKNISNERKNSSNEIIHCT